MLSSRHAATHCPPLPQGPRLPPEDIQVCGPRKQAGGLAVGTGEHEWPLTLWLGISQVAGDNSIAGGRRHSSFLLSVSTV